MNILAILSCLSALGASDVQITSLRKGLILDMRLDVAHDKSVTVARDLSRYHHEGTATGTPPTWGAVGSGVALNGSSDYVLVPDHDAFTFGDGAGNDSPFSVCAWVNMVDATQFPLIVRRISGAVADQDWGLYVSSDDKLYFRLFDDDASASIYAMSSSVVTARENLWTLFCGVYDGSESETGVNLYQNGSALAQTQIGSGYTSMTNKAMDTWIGKHTTSYSNGSIWWAQIYARALSVPEIGEMYLQGR